MLQLASVIDDIWLENLNRDALAVRLAAHLTNRQLLEVVAFDLFAALRIELQGVSVSFGQNSVVISRLPSKIIEVQRVSTAEEATISYCDVPAFFKWKGGQFQPQLDSRTAASILSTLQICRDHVDGTIYFPPELREKALKEYAADADMDIESFKYLAGSFGILSQIIEI